MMSLLPPLFAFALGFKHAYDADHLLAVSNFLVRNSSIRRAVVMSINWALGHMLTSGAITLVLYLTFSEFMISLLSHFEIGIGVMLMVLGVLGIAWETWHLHVHPHRHGDISHAHSHVHAFGFRHFHPHLFAVGIVQGLASNDEIFSLLMIPLGVTTLPSLLTSIGIFSLGVASGMVVFGYLMSYSVGLTGDTIARRKVGFLVGAMSISCGLFLLFEL